MSSPYLPRKERVVLVSRQSNTVMLSLRRATLQDVEALLPVAIETFRDGWTQVVGTTLTERYITERLTKAHFTADIAREGVYYILALEDQTIIGYALLDLAKTPPTDISTTAALLQRLYIIAAMRGQGVADALLSHCETIAQDAGRTHFWLECDPRNPRAWQFYLKRGFADAGPSPYPIPGDPNNQVRYMVRAIGPILPT
jgi:diamine N-acetyltransferase